MGIIYKRDVIIVKRNLFALWCQFGKGFGRKHAVC